MKPFKVDAGEIAPAFEQPGGGIQYVLDGSAHTGGADAAERAMAAGQRIPEGVAVALMNRVEMREALRRAGIADGLYEIAGLHHAKYPGNGFDFLEERDGTWIVGAEERGRREVVARISNEDEACRFFHDRLVAVWVPRTPSTQTPEEEERGRRITEEAVRKIKDMMKARED